MSYFYLDEIATADAAFHAQAGSFEELLCEAIDATLGVMIEDPKSVQALECKKLTIMEESEDMLLFQVLQELIFMKDAKNWVFRIQDPCVSPSPTGFRLDVKAVGEKLNREKHSPTLDVKAVTLHQFNVSQTKEGWEATVVLDI